MKNRIVEALREAPDGLTKDQLKTQLEIRITENRSFGINLASLERTGLVVLHEREGEFRYFVPSNPPKRTQDTPPATAKRGAISMIEAPYEAIESITVIKGEHRTTVGPMVTFSRMILIPKFALVPPLSDFSLVYSYPEHDSFEVKGIRNGEPVTDTISLTSFTLVVTTAE